MAGVPHIRVRVPATTANLGPGFDAFGAAVSLHLEAWTVPRDAQDGRVRCGGEGAGELPGGDDNLLWRSFLALCAHAGTTPPDVAVCVDSAVPLERGLGSSAAAIVAGLGLARAAAGVGMSDLELVRIAAAVEGHPDNVAPAVVGGLVCASRTDDGALVVRRAQPHARLRPVACLPTTRLGTSAARAVLPEALSRDDAAAQASRAGHVLAALAGVWPADPQLGGDLLHEPPRAEVMAGSGELLAALRADGVHAWLSGAGPGVCAAVPAADPDLLARVRRVGAEHRFDVVPLRWDLSGLVTLAT